MRKPLQAQPHASYFFKEPRQLRFIYKNSWVELFSFTQAEGGEPMNISKFTQKSVQAVQDLEKVATNMATRKSNRSICYIPS